MVLLKEFKRGVRFRKGVVQATEKRSFLKLMYIYAILCSNFNHMSRATGLTFFCVENAARQRHRCAQQFPEPTTKRVSVDTWFVIGYI